MEFSQVQIYPLNQLFFHQKLIAQKGQNEAVVDLSTEK